MKVGSEAITKNHIQNLTEYCGGSHRLNLYSRGGLTPVLAPPGSTPAKGPLSAPVPTPTSKTTTPNVIATALPTGWLYQGCYVDNVNGRIFNNQQQDNPAMTVESCVATCVGLGFSVASMEFGVQCFCDTFVRNGGVLAAQGGECSVNCAGNAGEMCGGANRLSVYSNASLQVYQPPGPAKDHLPGKWTYIGKSSTSVEGVLTLTKPQVVFRESPINQSLSIINLM